MPIVNVQGFGTVQFPDEMAPDAIEAAIRADIEPLIDQRRRIAAGQAAAQLPPVSPTLAGMQGAGSALSSAAGSVVQGGVSALTSPLKLAGTIADRIRANVPPAAVGPQLAVGGPQSALTTGAEAIQQAAERIAPTDPAVEQTFFGGTLPQGLGNAGAMLATGGLAGLGAKAAGRAAQPAAVAGATAVGFTAEFDDAFQRAVQAGQDPDTALAKSLGYAGVAAAIENKLGMGRVLRKYFGSADEAAKALTARGVSQEFLKDALAGFGEEASQRVAQDVIIEGKLDPKGIVEEGAAGGIIQALMGLPALNRQAVPKTGTAQPPVTPDVTPPAPEQPKVEVTRDLAKELQAALTGNQGKAPPVTPAVTPPAPAQPAGPLRFRAIVEEGKVPSELVIQPLTEELYDAVIHVEGLTPDFDQFKAENPEATHLKRQLLPTGKFASGHKFGALNELVPPGIGSQWEDITNPEPSTKNQAPPAPTSPPPPAAAVPPPAAPAPPAPAAAVSPAPATAQTPQALPSSPAGDSLAAPLTPPAPEPGAADAPFSRREGENIDAVAKLVGKRFSVAASPANAVEIFSREGSRQSESQYLSFEVQLSEPAEDWAEQRNLEWNDDTIYTGKIRLSDHNLPDRYTEPTLFVGIGPKQKFEQSGAKPDYIVSTWERAVAELPAILEDFFGAQERRRFDRLPAYLQEQESRAALRQPGQSKPTDVTGNPSLSRPGGATPESADRLRTTDKAPSVNSRAEQQDGGAFSRREAAAPSAVDAELRQVRQARAWLRLLRDCVEGRR